MDAGEILKREPEDLHARCRGEQRAEAPVVSPGEFYSLPEKGSASLAPADNRSPLFFRGTAAFCCLAVSAILAAIPTKVEGWPDMGKKKQNLNYARNMDIDNWHDRQVCKRLAAQMAQQERDFIRAHGGDSNEQLQERVLKRARQLGRMPHPLEIPGGRYIQQRLGDWGALALSLGYTPVSQRRGAAAYKRIKDQATEDFFRERRAQRAEKKLEKLAKHKEANRIQAAWEKSGRQMSKQSAQDK